MNFLSIFFLFFLFPFLLIFFWTFLGWLLTSTPLISSFFSFLLIFFFIGISSLYNLNELLLFQLLLFLCLFLFTFIYRSFTKRFKVIFLLFIIILQCYFYYKIQLQLQNYYNYYNNYNNYSTSINYKKLIYTIQLECFSSFLTMILTFVNCCILLNLWLPITETSFIIAEENFLQSRCKNRIVRMIVASLGTFEVIDEYVHSNNYNNHNNKLLLEDISSKPIIVLLHGYGGFNAEWVECLSQLQKRYLF